MGRIKTTMIKRVSARLLEESGDSFTNDFEKNKKVVEGLLDVKSKKIKNVVAGHITRLKRDNKNKNRGGKNGRRTTERNTRKYGASQKREKRIPKR